MITKLYIGMVPAAKQYARNGRWGWCEACPNDQKGALRPELCQNTNRSDHNGDISEFIKENDRLLGTNKSSIIFVERGDHSY